MAKVKDTDYLYSTSRVRSIEKFMLTHERAEKMIDAKNNEDALRILYDCNYGIGKDPVAASNFEVLLAEEHKKTYDFITSIAPDMDNFKLFLYAYDYHNLKVIIKSEFLNIDSSESLVDTGSIDIKLLKHAVKERDFSDLTEHMKNALNEVFDVFPKNRDPQVIDIIFDKACYNEMLKSSESLHNKFIEDYVRMVIDTVNLKTFVRIKRMKKSPDFFHKVFIEGGIISEQKFMEFYDEPFEKFADALSQYGFKDLFLGGISALEDTGKFTTLEKLCDDKLISHVRSSKYVLYGIEPLASYLIAKENEIKIARIIMAGKLAGIPSELIRERMRDTYV